MVRGQELSVVLSECLLAFSAAFCAGKLYVSHVYATISFVIIAVAALAGAARFGGSRQPSNLVFIHKNLFWLVDAVAVPLIVVSYLMKANIDKAAIAFIVAIALLPVMWLVSDKSTLSKITWIVDGSSLAGCLIVCAFIKYSPYGLTGIGLYAVAGILVTSEGYYGSVPRIDVFHYLLVIGNLAFTFGLLSA